MVIKNIQPLRRTSNVDIVNAIRHDATTTFQSRIPEATRANIRETLENIVNYEPTRNEFIHALVNKIGLTLFRNNSWTNPLAEFKVGQLSYGETIEEIVVGLIEATTYDPNREALERELFGSEEPETQVYYHKVNRRDKYKLTVKEPLLRQAFLTGDGLSTFIAQLMQMPATSDQWDEFLLMASLFGEYHANGGFFKVQIPDVSAEGSTEADAKFALRRYREMADTLPFISRHYNAAHMPVAVDRNDLMLFTTPEAQAAVDVEALAGAFNVEKAQMANRTIVIPKEHFNIPGAQALLTTRDFFVVADQLFETREQPNAVSLATNFWLHHWQVISASLAAPAILFTTEEGDVIPNEVIDLSSVEVGTGENGVYDDEGNKVTSVERGKLYDVRYTATPENASDVAVIFTLEGAKHPATYILNTGSLLVSPFETADTLTVRIRAVNNVDINDTVALTVTGDLPIQWPNPEVLPDADNDGVEEVIPQELTKDADTDIVKIPSVRGVQYLKEGVNVNNGSEHVITAETDFTAVARAGYELAAGAPAAWTFNA